MSPNALGFLVSVAAAIGVIFLRVYAFPMLARLILGWHLLQLHYAKGWPVAATKDKHRVLISLDGKNWEPFWMLPVELGFFISRRESLPGMFVLFPENLFFPKTEYCISHDPHGCVVTLHRVGLPCVSIQYVDMFKKPRWPDDQ